jgi:hypothetical protein
MTHGVIDRPTMAGASKRGARRTRASRWLLPVVMVLALVPVPAHAQLGRLKKLKQKFSAPDSAARAKDSLAQIAAGVLPESVKINKSFLQKSASVVSSANGALESATGISAKDAALAASGIGASNLVAKKLGLDPMSIGQQALANARMNAQQRAMQRASGGGMGSGMGMPAGAGGMDPAAVQAMQQASAANAAAMRANVAAAPTAGAPAMSGYSQADVDALIAFQQEMTQLSMAASAGDAKATARLQAWETLALKYQPQMQTLSIAAGAGDMGAAQRMQRLQFDMIREWTGPAVGRAKAPKVKRP